MTARVETGRDLLGSALVTASVLVGLSTLAPLLQPGRWLPLAVIGTVALGVATALTRRATRRTATPTAAGLAGLLALVGLLVATAAPGPDAPALPTGPLDRLTTVVTGGVGQVVQGVAPVEPGPGLELLLVVGVLATLLVVDLLALGLDRPGLGGLALLGLWATPTTLGFSPSPVTVVVGGTAFLMLLWAAGPPTRRRDALAPGRRDAVALGWAALVAVLAVALSPVVATAPFFASVQLPAGWGSPGVGPLSLSTDLDVRSSLAARSDREVLRYSATDAPGPLRTHTLMEFDGTGWSAGDAGVLTPATGLLWPAVPPAADEPQIRVRVVVGALDEDHLPLPTDPRTLDLPEGWTYDPVRDEVVAGGALTTRDLTYEVAVLPRDLSSQSLRDDVATRLEAQAPELAVPASPFADEIAELAVEVTDGAPTAYDQALALQSFFRDAGTFRYETAIPPAQTDDALWDFLQRRSGYCVQYATAMAVMSRTLGIPARVAVGFLPGSAVPGEPGLFRVTARQAHAWPELWFADAGWVRFEPTPAIQSGAPPAYADPFLAGPAPSTPPTPNQLATPAPAPSATSAPAPGAVGPGATPDDAGTPWPTVLVLGLVGLVVAALGVATWRRSTSRQRVTDPEGAWLALRAAAARHDVTWSDATTPRGARTAVLASWPLRGRHPEATVALDALVAWLEESRYAPAGRQPSPAELRAALAAVTLGWTQQRGGDQPSGEGQP